MVKSRPRVYGQWAGEIEPNKNWASQRTDRGDRPSEATWQAQTSVAVTGCQLYDNLAPDWTAPPKIMSPSNRTVKIPFAPILSLR